MLISDLFEKDVTRTIPPVVYFHEQSPAKLKDEVDEYIITGGYEPPDPRAAEDGIHEQFVRLLTGLKQHIGGSADPGCWISGFFGSGKSSFAKLLGLALDGAKLPNGKPLADALLAQDRSRNSADFALAWHKLVDSIQPLGLVFDIGSKARDDEHIHAVVVRQLQERMLDLFHAHRSDLELNAYRGHEVNETDFVEVYPMLPGHIDLLMQITTGLRSKSSRVQGDSHAIRGLLQLLGDLFREQDLVNREPGYLITMDRVYDVLHTALSTDVQATLTRAFEFAARQNDVLMQRVVKTVAMLQQVQDDKKETSAELVARCLYERLGQGNQLPAVQAALDALVGENLLAYSEKGGYKVQSTAGQEWQNERDSYAPGPPRAQDAKFHMDVDDGVMINSAALWPLLEPLWTKPKAWWKELCQAKGRKDYDWSHLVRRYFPARVEEKCKLDPSLGVAHGCFWKYHPAKAYAWELRLQHEIKPDFTIDEPDSDAFRARFLEEHPDEAAAIREKEQLRRDRAGRKKAQAEGPDSDGVEEGEATTEEEDET